MRKLTDHQQAILEEVLKSREDYGISKEEAVKRFYDNEDLWPSEEEIKDPRFLSSPAYCAYLILAWGE